MQLPLYQVDAFADRLFAGNPAAVCPLDRWLPDATMQAIAAENNLSETAFFVPLDADVGEDYALRWFTPTVEVDLCGHATLASAFVVANFLAPEKGRIRFQSKSGPLTVTREGELFALDFPARPPRPCPAPDGLAEALGAVPTHFLAAASYLAVFDSRADVADLAPDMAKVAALGHDGIIVTAPAQSDGLDFVSRYFVPSEGIPEDPVTGAAHCTLIPYWAERLGKERLRARQISRRGGEVICEHRGDRVGIAGRARLYLEGKIHI